MNFEKLGSADKSVLIGPAAANDKQGKGTPANRIPGNRKTHSDWLKKRKKMLRNAILGKIMMIMMIMMIVKMIINDRRGKDVKENEIK